MGRLPNSAGLPPYVSAEPGFCSHSDLADGRYPMLLAVAAGGDVEFAFP